MTVSIGQLLDHMLNGASYEKYVLF